MGDTLQVTSHGWKCIENGGNAVKGEPWDSVVVLGQVEGKRDF